MSAFPLFPDPLQSLKNWSKKLADKFRYLEEDVGQYIIGREVATNESWNGQRVYRKVIDFGALPNTATKGVGHGVTFSKILSVEGITYNSDFSFPLPFNNPNTLGLGIALYVQGADIEIITGADRTAFTETYVTIRYIK